MTYGSYFIQGTGTSKALVCMLKCFLHRRHIVYWIVFIQCDPAWAPPVQLTCDVVKAIV